MRRPRTPLRMTLTQIIRYTVGARRDAPSVVRVPVVKPMPARTTCVRTLAHLALFYNTPSQLGVVDHPQVARPGPYRTASRPLTWWRSSVPTPWYWHWERCTLLALPWPDGSWWRCRDGLRESIPATSHHVSLTVACFDGDGGGRCGAKPRQIHPSEA